jgi:hypothetical protein
VTNSPAARYGTSYRRMPIWTPQYCLDQHKLLYCTTQAAKTSGHGKRNSLPYGRRSQLQRQITVLSIPENQTTTIRKSSMFSTWWRHLTALTILQITTSLITTSRTRSYVIMTTSTSMFPPVATAMTISIPHSASKEEGKGNSGTVRHVQPIAIARSRK